MNNKFNQNSFNMKQLLILAVILLPFIAEAQRSVILSRDYSIVQADTMLALRERTIEETGIVGINDTTIRTIAQAADTATLLQSTYVSAYNEMLEQAGRVRQAGPFTRYFQTHNSYATMFGQLGVDMETVLVQNTGNQYLGLYRIFYDSAGTTLNFLADLVTHPNPEITNRLRLVERNGARAYNVALRVGGVMAILNFHGAQDHAWLMDSGQVTPNERALPIFAHPTAVVMPGIWADNRVRAVKINN